MATSPKNTPGFWDSIKNAAANAATSVSDAAANAGNGLSNAVGLKAADPNADANANADAALMQRSGPVNAPLSPGAQNGTGRRRVRKTKKGSSRRRRHSRASRRKMSRSNK